MILSLNFTSNIGYKGQNLFLLFGRECYPASEASCLQNKEGHSQQVGSYTKGLYLLKLLDLDLIFEIDFLKLLKIRLASEN